MASTPGEEKRTGRVEVAMKLITMKRKKQQLLSIQTMCKLVKISKTAKNQPNHFIIPLFCYFMEQQSLPTCLNHTGDGLPVLTAQIAHLLQFTDALVEAVPTASCCCHLVGLFVCPALAGRCENQTASSTPTRFCNQRSKLLHTS